MNRSIGDVKAGLADQSLIAKEHIGSGGRFYRVLYDIYENDNRVKGFYQCLICK